MSIYCGNSTSGNIKEAFSKLKSPKFIFMFVNEPEEFESKVAELKVIAPDIPSVACVAKSYSKEAYIKGVTLMSFDSTQIDMVSGMLYEASTAPAKYIRSFEDNIKKIQPGKNNTVCITFCTGHDAKVISTMEPALKKYNICETGGTVDQAKVAYCGEIFEDAAVYVLAKYSKGKVKTFKENLYTSKRKERFIASETDISNYYVGKLNGKSAKEVYKDALGIKDSDIQAQTFENPLGKMVGDECYIVSLKDSCGTGFTCYKQVNDSDILSILDIQNTDEVVSTTIDNIRQEFKSIDGVFSINCVFRYLYLDGKGEFGKYLTHMSELGNHYGYVGYGEHLDGNFVNQTMACVVFGN